MVFFCIYSIQDATFQDSRFRPWIPNHKKWLMIVNNTRNKTHHLILFRWWQDIEASPKWMPADSCTILQLPMCPDFFENSFAFPEIFVSTKLKNFQLCTNIRGPNTAQQNKRNFWNTPTTKQVYVTNMYWRALKFVPAAEHLSKMQSRKQRAGCCALVDRRRNLFRKAWFVNCHPRQRCNTSINNWFVFFCLCVAEQTMHHAHWKSSLSSAQEHTFCWYSWFH